MRKTLFISAGVLLAVIFLLGVLYFNAEKAEQAEMLAEQNRLGLVRDHAPTLGPTAAKVRIVEFLDPACGTCKRFYPFVKDMLIAHPDEIHLTVRYAPFHQNADYVVAMLFAAQLQGKHWETLEALLNEQQDWVQNHVVQRERVWRHVKNLGLNLEQLRADMNSPEVIKKIELDMADVQLLNVSKTPDFYVNGKPLPSFGYDQLKTRVDEALASAYP